MVGTEDLLVLSSIIGNIMEFAVIIILLKWLKFDKKEAKKRKPRAKKADVQVTVPTVVKLANEDEE